MFLNESEMVLSSDFACRFCESSDGVDSRFEGSVELALQFCRNVLVDEVGHFVAVDSLFARQVPQSTGSCERCCCLTLGHSVRLVRSSSGDEHDAHRDDESEDQELVHLSCC